MVENRETRGRAGEEESLALFRAMGDGEEEAREREAMRDWRLRGALWVSRLSDEEADMMKKRRGRDGEKVAILN
jgi:hypothetical protein